MSRPTMTTSSDVPPGTSVTTSAAATAQPWPQRPVSSVSRPSNRSRVLSGPAVPLRVGPFDPGMWRTLAHSSAGTDIACAVVSLAIVDARGREYRGGVANPDVAGQTVALWPGSGPQGAQHILGGDRAPLGFVTVEQFLTRPAPHHPRHLPAQVVRTVDGGV